MLLGIVTGALRCCYTAKRAALALKLIGKDIQRPAVECQMLVVEQHSQGINSNLMLTAGAEEEAGTRGCLEDPV